MTMSDNNSATKPEKPGWGKSITGAPDWGKLPENLLRYALEDGGLHQLFLAILAVSVFLLEFVPLELTRRIVDAVTKHRGFKLTIVLGVVYVGAVLIQGGTKLVLNVYRGWVSERATRNLRNRVLAVTDTSVAKAPAPETVGTELSMLVSEVEPIGAFVSESISEPLLQGGVVLCLLAYMVHVQLGIAVVAFVFFVPQLVFVPMMQGAVNWRTKRRVALLREVSADVVAARDNADLSLDESVLRVEKVFKLGMGIFRFKYSMNFLMNLCTHGQIVGILMVGGWYVYTDQLNIGGVVAFLAAVNRLNDPWGDLVNYFRDLNSIQVRYRLLAESVNRFM